MLFRLQDEIYVKWKRDENWGNVLLLMEESNKKQDLILCFVEVYLSHRLNAMIKKISHDMYYYTDVDELERICQLTNRVIVDTYYTSRLFNESITLKQYLTSLLQSKVTNNRPINFDSLFTFGVKPFIEILKLAVGYGIDEMKREEEYQDFIQSTREFIMRRQTKIPELYIVQGEPFTFYKPCGKKYTDVELRTKMSKEPLYVLGLDGNEMNVSPILTLLPEKIYMYGDHPSEPKTLTIINLFQERVQFFPKTLFPFHPK